MLIGPFQLDYKQASCGASGCHISRSPIIIGVNLRDLIYVNHVLTYIQCVKLISARLG